jgi:UDP-N-acetylmuramoylalanine--D-glutamate ligase
MVLDRPDRGIVEGALGRFDPLPHRAELLEDTGDLRVIEDSKATNPDAVEQLIHSVEGPFRLLLGGEGKDADFGPLFHALNGADLSGLGVCGGLADELIDHAEQQGLEYERFDDWETAVKEMVRGARSGETVVLSPGGTSFDAFEDYKERGEHFQQWVRETVGR